MENENVFLYTYESKIRTWGDTYGESVRLCHFNLAIFLERGLIEVGFWELEHFILW